MSSWARYVRAPARFWRGVDGDGAWNARDARGARGGIGDVNGDERNAAMDVICVAESWRTRQASWIWRRAQMRPAVW